MVQIGLGSFGFTHLGGKHGAVRIAASRCFVTKSCGIGVNFNTLQQLHKPKKRVPAGGGISHLLIVIGVSHHDAGGFRNYTGKRMDEIWFSKFRAQTMRFRSIRQGNQTIVYTVYVVLLQNFQPGFHFSQQEIGLGDLRLNGYLTDFGVRVLRQKGDGVF